MEKNKGGAPRRDDVDKLRTRLWFHGVKLASGLPSAYAIELKLEPELVKRDASGVARPRKWDGYEAGDHTPKRITGKRYAVDWAEKHFPGTYWYFESPLWTVLRKGKISERWIDHQLRSTRPRVQKILFEDAPREGSSERRYRPFDDEAATALAGLRSFEALTVIVLLIAKSELIASAALRDLAMMSYRLIQRAMLGHPVVGPFALELFQAIDLVCKHWVFPSPESRLDIVIFSNEVRRALEDDPSLADNVPGGDHQQSPAPAHGNVRPPVNVRHDSADVGKAPHRKSDAGAGQEHTSGSDRGLEKAAAQQSKDRPRSE